MKFPKQLLKDILYEESEDGKIIKNTVVDTSRWSIHHEMIFLYQGKYYETGYSEGATEYQDESPFEYDPDEIECTEVEPVQQMVTVYKAVKQTA